MYGNEIHVQSSHDPIDGKSLVQKHHKVTAGQVLHKRGQNELVGSDTHLPPFFISGRTGCPLFIGDVTWQLRVRCRGELDDSLTGSCLWRECMHAYVVNACNEAHDV